MRKTDDSRHNNSDDDGNSIVTTTKDPKNGEHILYGGQRYEECVPLKGHAHLIEGIVTFKNDINNGTDNVLSRENLPLQEV